MNAPVLLMGAITLCYIGYEVPDVSTFSIGAALGFIGLSVFIEKLFGTKTGNPQDEG